MFLPTVFQSVLVFQSTLPMQGVTCLLELITVLLAQFQSTLPMQGVTQTIVPVLTRK